MKSKLIDPGELRMLLVSPTDDRSALTIHFNNEYDDFLYMEYLETDPIGYIDISSWLDACDKLQTSRIASLKKAEQGHLKIMQNRYRQTAPAIPMNAVPSGPWRQRLELIREEMISEVEAGLSDAAISLAGHFDHIVSIVSKGLIYANEDHNGLIAFCHEMGQGPFFPALVHLPNTILTYPFLKFQDNAFTLFYPEGSIREEDDSSISSVTTIHAKNMRYARMDSDGSEFIFRMEDQFEDWRIDGGHVHEEWGDKSEAELLNGFRDLLKKNPGLELNLESMPHPVKDRGNFQTWLDSLIKYNLKLSYDQMSELLEMGEEAVEAALSIMPDTYSQKHRLLIRRAQKAMKDGDFSRSLKLYEAIDHLSTSYDPELLYLYSVLGKKQQYDKKISKLESEGAIKGELRLSVWLHALRQYRSIPQKFAVLEQELQTFVQDREGYRDQHYGMFPLCLVLSALGRSKEAVTVLRRVDFTESFLSEIASTELKVDRALQQAWEELEEERNQSEEIVERLKLETLNGEEKEECLNPEPSLDELEFVWQAEFEYERIKWADFLNPRRLILHRENRLELMEVGLENKSLNTIHAIVLENEAEYSFCLFEDQIFVMRYDGIQILQYSLGNDSFELTAAYGNSNRESRYTALGVHEGHLYAIAGPALEVFLIGESCEKPLSRTLFQRSGNSVYFISGHGNTLYVGSNDVICFDISNPSSPECKSRMAPFSSSEPHHISYWDHFMLADYLYDISDPVRPVPVEYICRDHAALRVFQRDGADASEIEIPGLFASGDSMGLLRQVIAPEENQATVKIWRNVMDKEREFPSRSVYPLSNMLCEDNLVTVSRDEIRFYTSMPVIQKPTRNAQRVLEEAIENILVEFQESENSTSPIGGLSVVLESYGAEFRLIAPSSIPSVNAQPLVEKHLFYSRDLPDFQDGTIVQADPEGLAKFFLSHKLVLDLAAGRVMVSIARRIPDSVALADPYFSEITVKGRKWEPLRAATENASVPQSAREILATKNKNLWNSLREEALDNDEVLQELLNISLEESPDGGDDSSDIPLAAVRAISRIKDEELVRRIFFAGITGHLPELDATRVRQADLSELLPVKKDDINPNYFFILLSRLWKDEPDDLELSILKATLAEIGGDLGAILAFRLQQWNHPALQNYVQKTLEDPYFHYYQFRGDAPGGLQYPDLSLVPDKLLKPHAELIRKKLQQLTEARNNVDTLAPYWQMLTTLGEPPSIAFLEEHNRGARDYLESTSFSFGRDDDTEDAEVFALRLERALKCQAMNERLGLIEKGDGLPLYDPLWKPEPYKKSWETLWSRFLDLGEKEAGNRDKYQARVLAALVQNLQIESEEYSSDLTMALRFLDYVLSRILQDPSIAESSTMLFEALDKQKHRLPENESFRDLRQKGLLSLLQSAWNDVKEKNYLQANQKCDAVLSMDSSMGQAYFLKARLIWLEKGVQAYLVQAEDFYQKATGDRAGLARLYNLTGCAYDELKEPARAIPYFERAASEVPNEAMYIANIAECHYKIDNAEKALQYAIHARDKGANSALIQEILQNQGIRSAAAGSE